MRILLSVLCVLLLCNNAYALPAFPGAEGFGSSTVGGRGGTVYIVDTLSDDPGDGMTFREACAASGARIIVFRVSGVIHLTSVLTITNPYLTIAGQTSPGGIAIAGGMVMFSTHDVISTHVRYRAGSDVCDGAGNCDDFGDAFRIMGDASNPAYNVIVDHCSFAWGNDETVDVSTYYGDTYNVTLSHCLIGQGLDDPEGQHALGLLISGKMRATPSQHLTITLRNNFIAHFRYRFPQIQAAYVDLYNNVMYNYNDTNTTIDRKTSEWSDSLLNTRHNYYKQGISTESGNNCTNAPNKHLGNIIDHDGANQYDITGTPTPLIHSNGNIACASIPDTTGKFASNNWSTGWPFLASGWISTDPISAATNGDATVQTMTTELANSIVANAGANRIANSGTPSTQSDSLDTTLINSWTTPGTVSWLSDMHYPTGWPTYTNTTPADDTDNDGMADAWETAQDFNVGVDDSATVEASGYTRIETYLHYLGGYVSSVLPGKTVEGMTIGGMTLQ